MGRVLPEPAKNRAGRTNLQKPTGGRQIRPEDMQGLYHKDYIQSI